MDNWSTEQKIYQNDGNKEVLQSVPPNCKYVLDIGCGSGSNGQILVKFGHVVDGITLSEAEAIQAKEYYRDVQIFNLESGLPELLKNRNYDCVICSHVIEHIAYPEKLLQDINITLSSEGVLIVALPNLLHYKSRLKLLLGQFNYEESGVWDYTHLRWYTFKTGRQLLEKNKFQVLKAWVDGELPFGRLTKRVLSEKTRIYIYKLLTKLSKGLFGGQLLYIAKKE